MALDSILNSASLGSIAATNSDSLQARAEGLARQDKLDKEESVAQKMEALFAQILVKELRRGLGDGFFGKGAGSDTFEGWLDEQLGKNLAREGVLDLAGLVRTSFDRERQDQERAALDEATVKQ